MTAAKDNPAHPPMFWQPFRLNSWLKPAKSHGVTRCRRSFRPSATKCGQRPSKKFRGFHINNNMKTIARKSWAHGAAFIQVDKQGNLSVFGKLYYDGFGSSGFTIPASGNLATLPPELLEEAMEISWQDDLSPELEAICNEVWAKAKIEHLCFGY